MDFAPHPDVKPPRIYGANTIAFGAGFLGTLVVVLAMAAARALGITTFNLESFIATPLTHRSGWGTWLVGLGIEQLAGGLIALVYAAGFRAFRRSGSGMGMVFGLVHWLIFGLGTGWSSAAPGFFGVNLGPGGFFMLLGVHLLYGAIVGNLYQPIHQLEFEQIEEAA